MPRCAVPGPCRRRHALSDGFIPGCASPVAGHAKGRPTTQGGRGEAAIFAMTTVRDVAGKAHYQRQRRRGQHQASRAMLCLLLLPAEDDAVIGGGSHQQQYVALPADTLTLTYC